MEDKNKLIKEILEDVSHDMTDEEIIHLILNKKVSKQSTNTKYSFGDRTSDNLAKFAGSWMFIIIFASSIVIWVAYNLHAKKNFDPYPFILLNLILSCVAAIQAPVIMMSQNRQEEKDRDRAENDYRVNVKTEIILSDLHNKIDQLLENQERIMNDQK